MTAGESAVGPPLIRRTVLARVLALYEQGLYVQAFDAASSEAPLATWRGAEEQVLAGRLAGNVGAPRLALSLHLRAGRAHPDHAGASYFFVRAVEDRQGPFAAWTQLQSRRLPDEASASERADWYALHASVAASLRDFEEADRWLARAVETAPGLPWPLVVKSGLLESQDRYAESVQAARQSLEVAPWYRPGVQRLAYSLLQSGRRAEALVLLTEGLRRCESAALATQLADLQMDLEMYEDAEQTFERVAALSPMMERAGLRWLAGRRSDVAWKLGRREEAIALAREAESPFHHAVADRLATGAEARSVLLDVPFVRQHHLTCAPATLASIAAYQDRPVDHLALAQRISYDGTPGRKEREWADESGWWAREFRVTWDVSVTLLERGIPFSLVTVGPSSAHEQAVVGFDAARGVLLVRDPSSPMRAEFLAAPLLEQQAPFGPRGFVVVPAGQIGRLDGITLPDVELYDLVYRMEQALEAHDRDAAQALRGRLEEAAPGHLLALHADRILAGYDGDDEKALAWADTMLQRHPDTATFVLARLAFLQGLGRSAERARELARLCADEGGHPWYWELYAEVLSGDARQASEAARLLRRARRVRPGDAGPLAVTARLLWQERRFDAALAAYRFAACLDDRNEDRMTAYFVAARHRQKTDEALRFLRDRCARFGGSSSRPAGSLFWALEELGRADLAFQALEQALALESADGSLALNAADAYARYGNDERARALLESARPRARRASWLRTAAGIAAYRGETADALACWREVLQVEPLAVDAHRALARLLASSEGEEKALAHLGAACERHPHHLGLHHAWLEHARDEGAASAEPVLRRMLALHPGDAWSRRELALVLSELRRFDEAFAELEVARQLDPSNPSWHCVHGNVLAAAGRMAEARGAFEEAVRLDVNHTGSLTGLADVLDTPAARREAWGLVRDEMSRQVLRGDSLFAFRARAALPPDELLGALREINRKRPDLWQTWYALVEQLSEMDQPEPALAAANEAVERFPLVTALRLVLAQVHRQRGDAEREMEALRGARRIDAADSNATRRLAEIAEQAGDLDEARRLLEEAVARAPFVPANHGLLASVEWRAGRREQAMARLDRALALEPGWQWAWERLGEWSAALETPARAADAARALTRRRPGEARSWLILSRVLSGPEQLSERLDALDRTVALNPRLLEAYDAKAMLLAAEHRYDEALAACRPAAWGEARPVELRGREAWVLAERGQLDEAIKRMRQVVRGEPSYAWGWTRLADWYERGEQWRQYSEAAAALVAARPTEALSYGYRGDARRRDGDRAGAKADFARALELDAAYRYARAQLIGMCLEDSEVGRAQQVLERHRPSVRDDAEIALEARVCAARNQKAEALERLRSLVRSEGDDPAPLEATVAALAGAGWGDDARRLVEQAAVAGASRRVALAFVRPLLAQRDFASCEHVVDRTRAGTPGRRQMLEALLESAAAARDRRTLTRVVRERRRELAADVSLWGTVGYAFVTAGLHRKARRWLSDWNDRSGVQPWMLYNLVLVLRESCQERAANRAGQAALAAPPDHTSALHAVWLAVDAASSGDLGEAERLLAQGEPATSDERMRFLWTMASAVARLRRGEGDFAWFRREAARARALRPAFTREHDLTRAYFLCAWRGAREAGGLGWPWGLLQWSFTELYRALT